MTPPPLFVPIPGLIVFTAFMGLYFGLWAMFNFSKKWFHEQHEKIEKFKISEDNIIIDDLNGEEEKLKGFWKPLQDLFCCFFTIMIMILFVDWLYLIFSFINVFSSIDLTNKLFGAVILTFLLFVAIACIFLSVLTYRLFAFTFNPRTPPI